MTAITAPPSAAAPARRAAVTGSALTGTGRLIRFNLRRDRVRIPAWLAGIALVQVGGASSYPGIYPTAADRQARAAIMEANPAIKALSGPGHGLDNYTYGAMMGNEYLAFMLIFVALMSVLMVVRHTRAEEESGRAELVRASVVGRNAQLTAALVTAALANLTLGALVAVGLGAQGVESVDWPGSVLFGAAYAMVGLVFAGVAAITVQITGYARAAAGMAGAVLGVTFAARAIGDAAGNGLSWLSPIGWAQAAAPYVDDRWWPLGLGLVVAVVLTAAGYLLSVRRDIGAGLRAERPGRPVAAASLGTPGGFAWRLQRASLLWWAVAMLFAGLSYGSTVDVIDEAMDNELIQRMLAETGGTLAESFVSTIVAVLAVVCTIFAIIAALRPRREESAGRAEAVLATGLSRTRWVATHVVIALAGGTGLLLVAGVGLGGGAVAVSGDSGYIWSVLGASLAYAPALWVTAGLAVAGFGLAPRAVGLAWALLGYAVFVVYLGGLLDLPGWAVNLSPYAHVPRMPAEEFTVLPLVVLTVLAAGLVTVGLVGFRRRDLDVT